MSKRTMVGDDGKQYTIKEKKPFYKRTWFIVLAVLIGLSIIGNALSGEDDAPQKVNQNDNTPVAVATDETEQIEEETVEEVAEEEVVEEVVSFKIGDTIQNDKMEIAITALNQEEEVTDESGYIYFKPDSEENVFIILDATIKNIGKEALTIDDSGFELYQDDVRFIPSTLLIDKGLTIETINPGTKIERQIFFDVPKEYADQGNFRLLITSGIFSRTGQDIEIELE